MAPLGAAAGSDSGVEGSACRDCLEGGALVRFLFIPTIEGLGVGTYVSVDIRSRRISWGCPAMSQNT